jgi:uncharacterized protein
MTAPDPEQPIFIDCGGTALLGILHHGAPDARRAVLVVVGGPQYRIGSHRQFVLLARRLAAAGVPVLRFDYRGMGDSGGEARTFESIHDDLAAAVGTLLHALPRVEELVLWGLCDAASAAAMYAPKDQRVTGLVLLNPWVRTAAGEAKAYLRHYYLSRLASRAFWAKLLSGGVQLPHALGGLLGFVRTAKGAGAADPMEDDQGAGAAGPTTGRRGNLPQRMLAGLTRFRGRTLLILSGNDLTAKEFEGLLADDRGWSAWAARPTVERRDLAEADHTFSTAAWRAQVEDWTLAWLASW